MPLELEWSRYKYLDRQTEKGQYVGTICEGDLLRVLSLSLTHPEIDLDSFEIKDIDFKINLEVARINESYEHLVELAVKQNFIPLVDDQGIFIGILRRQELIKELIAPHLNGMFVTPKDVDEMVKQISYTISEGLNLLFSNAEES